VGPSRGVGWAHGSVELPIKSAGSQEALATVKRSQRNPELIGRDDIPRTDEAVEELSFREALLAPSLRERRQKVATKPNNGLVALRRLCGRGGCGESRLCEISMSGSTRERCPAGTDHYGLFNPVLSSSLLSRVVSITNRTPPTSA